MLEWPEEVNVEEQSLEASILILLHVSYTNEMKGERTTMYA